MIILLIVVFIYLILINKKFKGLSPEKFKEIKADNERIQRHNEKLIKTLINLKDIGNTVIVVEHDTKKPEEIYKVFLNPSKPILGRVHKDKFMLDMRTIENVEDVLPIVD